MKFENIDLVDALRRIMDIHTQNYKEDFELDAGLLHSLAASQSSEDKHLLWMSRPNGTYLLPEREVYVEDSYENKVWEFYHEQTRDPILAYAVEIKGVEGDIVRGTSLSWTMLPMWRGCKSSPFRLRQWQSPLRTMPPFICLSAATGVKRSRWKKSTARLCR